MIITLETLNALDASTLTPLNEYDTVQLQNVRHSIINGLLRVMSEVHDHGHVFIWKTEDNFLMQISISLKVFPKTPKQTDKALR